MSLIITYIGSKGCVMIGDRRSIGFFGDEKRREQLEEKLYSGEIKTKDELFKEAANLMLTLKITDETQKVRKLGEVLVGEVKYRTPFETRRKRIYATTNGYNQVKLTGSNIDNIESGESAIVAFGNQITKKITNETINELWKPKITLKEIGEIFKRVMGKIAIESPTISSEYDIFIVHPQIDRKQARKVLRTTILDDVKELEKWREGLKNKMIDAAREIELASRIITQGQVGIVTDVKGSNLTVELSPGIIALDMEWNPLARIGDSVEMYLDEGTAQKGDKIVIEKENLCIEGKDDSIRCEVILCRDDE